MPLDSKGKFHLGSQRAHAADRATGGGGKGVAPAHGEAMDDGNPEQESVSHTTLHQHADGTHHLEHEDGSVTHHPHIGHALMHMAAKHGDGGKHMHIHHDGMKHTTHHVGHDGEVEGPHDHENIEALKDHLGQFFDEEANEWSGEDYGHAGQQEHNDGY